jgi:hypothetical protein
MAKAHRVAQGETLPGIADRYGFDADTLWNHSYNADLKAKRQNPCILCEGDVVQIPDDMKPTAYARATGTAHAFTVRVTKLKLRLAIYDHDRTAVADCAVHVNAGSDESDPTTDGDGVVEVPVAADATSGQLRVELPNDDPKAAFRWNLKIGHLDPADTESGWLGRLRNLGYYRAVDDDDDAIERNSAVEEFQCDQGLDVTGTCDADTQSKLVEVHGS